MDYFLCYSYHGTPSSSGRSTPTITEAQIVHTVQVGEWGTGNTTERSSTGSTSTGYSWDVSHRQTQHTFTVESLEVEVARDLFG